MNALDVAIARWNAHRIDCRHAVASAEDHRASCDTAARLYADLIAQAAALQLDAVRNITV